ncbi:hypothetical protein [Nocardia harenae]|uniref:hypothetical protein n=1 Tax=Nocardia harenae TaxID=358707 RepID=UPI000829B754|nr:hypothetical protein [Nocardia harenae]
MASLEQRYTDLVEAIEEIATVPDPSRLAELREQHAELDARCRRSTLDAHERHRLRRASLEADRLLTEAEARARTAAGAAPSSYPVSAGGGLSADTITHLRAALDRYHDRSRFH